MRKFLSILLLTAMLCSHMPALAATESGEYPILQMGSIDANGEVVALQQKLIDFGFLKGKADGQFGIGTQLALREFQEYNGIAPTGIADQRTQKLMFEGDINKISPMAYNNKSSIYTLQEMLGIWGFMHGSVDGISGKATEEGIINFKRYMAECYPEFHGDDIPEPTAAPENFFGLGDALIAMDDIADTAVMDYSRYITEEIMLYAEGALEFIPYNQDMKAGDSGLDVLRLQTRLQQLDYIFATDGDFGEATDRALKYFQYRNGLEETGIADETTQLLLFSDDAIESDQLVTQYKLVVDISEQKVYVYQWGGRSHSVSLGTMICSTGAKESPTPLGYYQAVGRSGQGEWYYFSDLDVYAKWGYYIIGDIMFHSVVYDADKSLRTGTVAKLGTQASHGCVRLQEENAKWIYENCSAGTTVIVQE